MYLRNAVYIKVEEASYYEGRSISNAPDQLPIAVDKRNLAHLLVFLYIGTTQSYAFLPSFDAALDTVLVEHLRLVLQPRRNFRNQGCIIWEILSFQKQFHIFICQCDGSTSYTHIGELPSVYNNQILLILSLLISIQL